jgi:hypothetical protein
VGKNLAKKTRGSWWLGWVKYTYYDPFTKSERESKRYTEYEFSTVGQAQRAADALAGAMAAPEPVQRRWGGRATSSKNDKRRQSRIKVIETGADRAEQDHKLTD